MCACVGQVVGLCQTNMADERGRSREIIDRILGDLNELSNALAPRLPRQSSAASLTVEDELWGLFNRRGGGTGSSAASTTSESPSTSTWPRPSRPNTSPSTNSSISASSTFASPTSSTTSIVQRNLGPGPIYNPFIYNRSGRGIKPYSRKTSNKQRSQKQTPITIQTKLYVESIMLILFSWQALLTQVSPSRLRNIC